MEFHNLGKDFQDQIENWLSPEAKSIREFIRQRYASEYDGMNAIYRLMFNVNMQQEENYARAGFDHSKKYEVITPEDGLSTVSGGSTISAIRGRINHMSEPVKMNALLVRMSHVHQISHWKATAEIARDLRAVFSDKDVRNSIIAKRSEATYIRLMNAVGILEAGGWHDSKSNNEMEAMVRNMMPTAIANGLGANISSIFAQASASIVSMSKIGPVSYFNQLGKIMENPKLLSEIYNDFSMELRRGTEYSSGEMLAMLTGKNRSAVALAITRAGEMGVESLAIVDSYLTVISGAITYLHHLEAVKGTMSSPVAEKEFALDKMRETIAETAQPDDFSRRSNIENEIATKKGFMSIAARTLFVFKSAARALSANIAHTISQAARGEISKKDAFGRMFAMIFIIPCLEQVMRSFIKDITSDEPDEKLYGDWKLFMAGMLSAPLTGVVGVGSFIDAYKVSQFGGYTVSVQDPITRVINEIPKAFKEIRDGEFDIKYLNAAMHITALGTTLLGVPGGPLLESSVNVMSAWAGWDDNSALTDTEKDEKYRKMIIKRKEAAERKKQRESN